MKRFKEYLREKNFFPLELEGIDEPIGLTEKDFGTVLNEFATLNEHYLNLFKKDDRNKYKDEVWDILQKSYKKSGGLLGVDNPDQLVGETDMWKLCRRNDKITAALCYSFKRGGRKTCYGGCDMTDAGKEDLFKIMKADMDQTGRKVWAEVSKAIEHIYIDKMHAPVIPAEVAQKILKDKPFEKIDDDGYHYFRKIGGKVERKIMVGVYDANNLENIAGGNSNDA